MLANRSLSTFRLAFLILAGVLLLTSAAGCSHPAGAVGGTAGRQGTLLRIVRPDGSGKETSLKDLSALGKGKILVDGKWEEGPTLPELLKLGGVTEFQHVTIIGSGAPPLTLSKEEVDSDVVLAITSQGKLRLALPDIPRNEWIDEVNTIKAE